MEHLINILIGYGFWGMFISAFLAGSILPFSSETVMLVLLAMGVNPWQLLLCASAGNSLGGITCYCVGLLATPQRVQQIFCIKPASMEKANRLVQRWGPWMGLLCWIPFLGDAILVSLGVMRCRPIFTNVLMIVGRTLRYAILLLSVLGVGKLFVG